MQMVCPARRAFCPFVEHTLLPAQQQLGIETQNSHWNALLPGCWSMATRRTSRRCHSASSSPSRCCSWWAWERSTASPRPGCASLNPELESRIVFAFTLLQLVCLGAVYGITKAGVRLKSLERAAAAVHRACCLCCSCCCSCLLLQLGAVCSVGFQLHGQQGSQKSD